MAPRGSSSRPLLAPLALALGALGADLGVVGGGPKPQHHVIDLRGDDKCLAGAGFSVMKAFAQAGETFNYNVEYKGTGSCEGSTGSGPSSCCFGWGTDMSVTLDFTHGAGGDLSALKQVHETKFQLFLGEWKDMGDATWTCPLCGGSCTTPAVEIAGNVVSPSATVQRPPCPEGSTVSEKISVMLPESMPFPMRFRTLDTIKWQSAAGADLAVGEYAMEFRK
mmetsp:Transcript_26517/g.74462  ORF Transcript_26517/g.74462 Transcript_26517/m.74462 type:complete len:222 (-) Transcript_26517:107-772(-)